MRLIILGLPRTGKLRHKDLTTHTASIKGETNREQLVSLACIDFVETRNIPFTVIFQEN